MIHTETTTKTKHSEIFNYWKNKCIRYDGEVFEEGSVDYSLSVPVVYDWGEPDCWCCGRIVPAENNPKYLEYLSDDNNLSKIYDFKETKHYLEKAHIVPHSLGGEDTPSNFFLLCKECHKNSPDTRSKKMFLKYIYQRRSKKHQDTFGINEQLEAMEEATEILLTDYGICKPCFDTKYLLKPIDEMISTHGAIIAKSSITYCNVLAALENKTGLSKEDDEMFRFFLNQQIEQLESKYKNANEPMSDVDKALLETYKSILSIYNYYKTIEMAKLDA